MPEYQKVNSAPAIEDCESVPEFLNKDYMEEKLRMFYKDKSLEVLSMNACSAIGKGENYGGILTRVTVQFKRSDIPEPSKRSYIVKSSLEGSDHASVIKHYDIYNREMNVYQNILPKLTALLEEIGDTDKMFPETIAVDYDNSTIIFEDLGERKFIMCDRLKGLDMEHVKMCIRKLAKMHATSAVLNEREPGTFSTYDRGFFNRHTNSFSPFFVGVLDACGRLVSQWEDFKEYGQKLIAMKPNLMEYGRRVFDLTEGQINVFAHGDFWINNVMFNYNEKEQPSDVIIIDFQYSCWGSPAIDLHYFFNTSMKEELRLHHQDELFQYYYVIFSKTLKALNFRGKIPTLHEFHIHMAEKSFYAFTSSCLIQPVMINENTEDADFDALMGEDERSLNFKNILFQNLRVQKNLRRLLPMFERRGLLDQRD